MMIDFCLGVMKKVSFSPNGSEIITAILKLLTHFDASSPVKFH